MLLQLIARQFRQPSGPLGYVWGRFMDRGNAGIIAGAVEALAPESCQRVLEIGFGGGLGLQLLLTRNPTGVVTGTELSDVMLSAARKRFAGAVAQNRLELIPSAVERIPVNDASFDGVVTVNTVYFWSDPVQGFAEILRVLRPGGRLVLGIRPADAMRRMAFTRHGFTLYEVPQLEEMLGDAGFVDIRSQSFEGRPLGHICVVAHKPVTAQ